MANFSDPYEQWKAQGRPGGSFSAWQGGQQAIALPPQAQTVNPLAGVGGSDAAVAQANAAYAAGQRGSDPNQIFQPGQLAQMRAGAAGNSEDYARFSNETMAGWEQYRQPGSMKYKSMRGAPGLFDKPTECPPGQGPSGPNETDPCTSVGYGGSDPQAGMQQQANPWAPQQPAMPQAPQMGAAPGGVNTGITGRAQIGLPQAIAPYQAPQQSATAGLLQQTMAGKQATPGVPAAMGTGWSAGQDGLAQMMAKQQRKPGVAGTGQWWT